MLQLVHVQSTCKILCMCRFVAVMAMNFDLLVSLVYVVMVATVTIDQSESRRSSEKPLGGSLRREARLVLKLYYLSCYMYIALSRSSLVPGPFLHTHI